MEIIKVDQLSFAARAGALDGSLAYAAMFQEHRDLVTQTALSGLRGLAQILSETDAYGRAMRTLQEASDRIDTANVEARKDPFESASGSRRDQHLNAIVNGIRSQGASFRPRAEALDNTAQGLINTTTANSPERALANDLKWASGELRHLGVGYLVNQADPEASLRHATYALDAALSAQSKAQQLMQTLQGIVPFPSERYNQAREIANTAGDVIQHANSLISFATQSPIAAIRNESPTTHDLGGGYSLSTWGNTGYWTLTDASGEGILVHPNGNVDSLNGGAGWKFGTTSTFVLPNQTKITVNPGSPANLLISRGVHAFTLSSLGSGSSPSVSSYTDLNGRAVDQASNDGHIIQFNGSAGKWQNNGNALGDTSTREVIGSVAISHEFRSDATDVSISSEMQAFLNEQDITDLDYDGDGKLNNEELVTVAEHASNYIKQIQDAYAQALDRLVKANQALNELNDLIESLRKESVRKGESRDQENVNAKSELEAIERRLVASLQSLQDAGTDTGTNAPLPVQGNIETNASQVLSQLTNIAQKGGVVPTPLGTTPTVSQTTSSSSSTTSSEASLAGGSDPLGDSLRRAGRLLSGILGGGNLNILEMPVKPEPGTGQQTPAGTETGASPASTEPPVLTQIGEPSSSPKGVTLDTPISTRTEVSPPEVTAPNTETAKGDVQDLTAGLNALLGTLTELGLAESNTDLVSLLKSLSTGIEPTMLEQLPAQMPESVTAVMASLAQLGALLSGQETSSPSVPVQPSSPSLSLSEAVQKLQSWLSSGMTVPSQIGDFSQLGQPATPTSGFGFTSPPVFSQVSYNPAGPPTAGSSGPVTASRPRLSRTAEQLLLVLQGLAALGSSGAMQSSGGLPTEMPSPAALRLGLQSLYQALSIGGLPRAGGPPTSPSSIPETAVTNVPFRSGNVESIRVIAGNFQTDPELLKTIRENLQKALQVQQEQFGRASQLFTQSQEIVQKFVGLIQEDDLLREVVTDDDLSDEQQAVFDQRMQGLRKDWGVEWGSDDDRTPASQSNLVSRAVQSGMMV